MGLQTTPATPNMLLVSGVNINSGSPQDGSRPTEDFLKLIDAFSPTVLDPQAIDQSGDAVLRLIAWRFGQAWAIAYAAFRQARRYNIIFATGEDVGLRLAFLLRFSSIRTPLLMTCHNIGTRRPAFYLGQLGAGKRVNLFQCLAHSQAAMLTKRYGISADVIQVIHWHVDHIFFQPQEQAVPSSQIVSAGMASRDYATLVAACAPLDLDLKIAADSPWFKQQLNIEAEQLTSRCEVRSYGTYAALRQLYAASQAVVVPLLDVPFSAGYTVILEAMAMGKPVIASKITQYDDFIVDGVNGFHVPPGDVNALREKIAYLLAHPGEAHAMGQRGRAMVEERFTLANYVDQMQDAVMRLTKQPITNL